MAVSVDFIFKNNPLGGQANIVYMTGTGKTTKTVSIVDGAAALFLHKMSRKSSV